MSTQLQERRDGALLTTAHAEYARGLSMYAFFKTHNPALADDLVQDTYLKTWRYIVRGGKIEKMKAFLYHTLNNLIVDEYRKKKTVSLDTLLERGFDPKDDDPEHDAKEVDYSAVLNLINQLPRTYQEIMRMRYVQHLTLTEIALIKGKTKNAVAVQLHRGLAKLRSLKNSTPQ